jgi:hypothetical protein
MAIEHIEPTNDGKDMTAQYPPVATKAQIGVATACRRGDAGPEKGRRLWAWIPAKD